MHGLTFEKQIITEMFSHDQPVFLDHAAFMGIWMAWHEHDSIAALIDVRRRWPSGMILVIVGSPCFHQRM